MRNIQFQCTLSTPNNKPLYKTYRGIGLTYIELLADIHANVKAMTSLGIQIIQYDEPTLEHIVRCWSSHEELVYTINCIDSQFNVVFRLLPKHIEQ